MYSGQSTGPTTAKPILATNPQISAIEPEPWLTSGRLRARSRRIAIATAAAIAPAN